MKGRDTLHTYWCQGCGNMWQCNNTRRPCIIRKACNDPWCKDTKYSFHYHYETVPEVIQPKACKKCGIASFLTPSAEIVDKTTIKDLTA